MRSQTAVECRLSKDILLVFVPRPTDPDQKWIDATEAKYPGLKVRWIPIEDKSTGKTRKIEDIPVDAWKGVTLLTTLWPPAADLIKDVHFIQVPSAGADRWIPHEKYKDPNTKICMGNGTHATQIAEWVIGAWIMARHQFLAYAEYMKDGSGFDKREAHQGDDSIGTRVGILGYGAIGRQVARIANSLGMEIYAYTRSEKATPEARRDDSFCLPGTGDAAGELPARWFHGPETSSINHFLEQDLDLLVVATPLTAATTGLLNTEQFAILGQQRQEKRSTGTYVINVARGKVINTDALIAALEQGRISGAALDVTDPEPLPADHPLWHAPNVFITPHVSWQSSFMYRRTMMLLDENLERLNAGKPLINVINKEHHY